MQNASAAVAVSRLTPREREVLALMIQAKSNKEIGVELKIGTRTAKSHVENILHKFHVSNRLELLANLVDPHQ